MLLCLSRIVSVMTALLIVAILATACGLVAGDDALVVAAPEVTAPALLPFPDESGALAEEPAGTSVELAPTAAVPTAESVAPTATAVPDVLSCLSTRRRVAQVLLPLVFQPELAGARVFAQDGELGAIGLLGEPDDQLKSELQALQDAAFLPVMVASDEEGGSVQRLRFLLGPIPSAAASTQEKTPEEVRNQWVEYGSRVRDQGIHVVFGPVLDVGSGPGIESRSFSADPAIVTAYGRAVADGLIEAGVMPVFKHFPGHGRGSADSHLELPSTPSLDELRTSDLVPYFELLTNSAYSEQAAVMVGHLAVPGLSGELPTSLSPETITGLLRSELGFGGLVFSDSISMQAIVDGYGTLEALELSLRAGTDVIILGSLADLTPALDHLSLLAEADAGFGAIIDNRAARVLAAKGQSNFCTGAQ